MPYCYDCNKSIDAMFFRNHPCVGTRATNPIDDLIPNQVLAPPPLPILAPEPQKHAKATRKPKPRHPDCEYCKDQKARHTAAVARWRAKLPF